MISQLPKLEACWVSDPNRLGLLLHPRTLYQNPLDFGRASALKQTRSEKPCRTPKDSNRASVLELRGGLLIGWEALWPSGSLHSPDKAMPSYYTKNESFASGISK
jgi:hypothetical protein